LSQDDCKLTEAVPSGRFQVDNFIKPGAGPEDDFVCITRDSIIFGDDGCEASDQAKSKQGACNAPFEESKILAYSVEK